MAVPAFENDRASHMNTNHIRQAAKRLREMFGESTKSFVAQGDFIISRLRASRPDALAAPQGKKLLMYVSEGQRALACLPLLEAGWLRENDALLNLEATMQKISEARVVLSHAARKRSRSFSGRVPRNGDTLSDGETEGCRPTQCSAKKSKYHSYAGGDGAYIARLASSEYGGQLWDTSLVKRLETAGIEIPRHYICPITQDIMRDPILLTGDGRNYEKTACARWLVGNSISPVTHEPLPACNFMSPAHALKAEITLYLNKHIDVLQPLKSQSKSLNIPCVPE